MLVAKVEGPFAHVFVVLLPVAHTCPLHVNPPLWGNKQYFSFILFYAGSCCIVYKGKSVSFVKFFTLNSAFLMICDE